MSLAVEQHTSEIHSGLRFEFGKNWQRFLKTLTDERIRLAERSLTEYLGLERFDGLRFLDIGSGSGLFSLAARQLGAIVTSFDYDPYSVSCTSELRRRYFPEDPRWTVQQGSVLDRKFLSGLGPVDIVYSWGVLHHTGAMEASFENIKSLVPIGGRLFIAIYNDLGEITDWWWRVKRRYNSLPMLLKLPFALSLIGASEARILAGHLRRRDLLGYLQTWTDYQNHSVRGMSRWHDWIDWIGGFPYERMSIDAVVDIFARSGFRLTKLVDRSSGYGCNEFVFRREGLEGFRTDNRITGSRFLSRRFGVPLVDVQKEPDGELRGRCATEIAAGAGAEWIVLEKDRYLGCTNRGAEGVISISPAMAAKIGADPDSLRLVAGHIETLNPPFMRNEGQMWASSAPHLGALADNATDRGPHWRSPVFIFEDDRQLAFPHSLHKDIRRSGGGRFSHWGDFVYFSTPDGSDPNRNGRRYTLIYPQA